MVSSSWFSNWDSCFKGFIRLPVLKFHNLGGKTPRKLANRVYLPTFTNLLWYADSVAGNSNHFLLFEWFFDAKVLFIALAVTQNCCFIVFRFEATKKHSYGSLIRLVRETIVMKNSEQFLKLCQLRCVYVWLYDWDL